MEPVIDDGVDGVVAVALQVGLDMLNAQDPPAFDAPYFLGNFRHPCMGHRIAKKSGKPVSTAVQLKERYVTEWREDGSPVYEGDGATAILYKEGTCPNCKGRVRSKAGRVVLTAERPPVYGRVSRD